MFKLVSESITVQGIFSSFKRNLFLKPFHLFELFKIGLVIGEKIPIPEFFTPNFVEWRIFPRVECGLIRVIY